MEEKKITNPVKAIRAKCLDCYCGSSNEVELCTCTGCACYPFRRGKNPYRVKPELSEEEKARRAELARKATVARMRKSETV